MHPRLPRRIFYVNDSGPAFSVTAWYACARTGPIVAAARAVAGNGIDRAAMDTGGFRFGRQTDFRDPQFLPGGAQYLDLPGLRALAAPQPLRLAGEGARPELVADLYYYNDE